MFKRRMSKKKLEQRALSVVRSCETVEQLDVAEKYCALIAGRLHKDPWLLFKRLNWFRDVKKVIDTRREIVKYDSIMR